MKPIFKLNVHNSKCVLQLKFGYFNLLFYATHWEGHGIASSHLARWNIRAAVITPEANNIVAYLKISRCGYNVLRITLVERILVSKL